MAKTSEATRRAIQKYKQGLDEIRFNAPSGSKDALRRIADSRGYSSMQAYLQDVIEKDSGLSMDIKKDAGA